MRTQGTSLVVQWLRLRAPNAGGLGSILGQGTRSRMPQLRAHMPQLKIPHAAMKIPHRATKIPRAITKTWRRDFLGVTVVKNPPANARDMGSIPGPGRSHMPRNN